MKTPEEIKRGMALCKMDECFGQHEDCPYAGEPSLCVGAMCDDGLAYIQQLEQRVPSWISVEERLPEDGVEVIVHSDRFGGSTHTAYYRHARQEWFEHNGVRLIPNVWHWMPMPEPPEE